MAPDETRLFLLSSGAITASGVLWYLPGLNALAAVAAVVGLILIVTRLGYTRAILASIIGAGVVFSIGSLTMGQLGASLNIAIYLVVVILPGIAMGVAARAFASPIKTIWYGFVPIILLMLVFAVYYSEIADSIPAVLREVNAQVVEAIELSPSLDRMLSDKYGPDIVARERFLKEVDDFLVFFIKIMPGTIIISYLSVLVLGLLAAGHIGARVGIMIPRLRPFYLWRASDWWLIPTAIGLGLAILAGDDFWRYAGGNLLVVTGNIYSVTGLAIVEAFFRRLSVPLIIRLVIYAIMLILIMPVGMAILAVLGLADSRFNFRRESDDKNDNYNEITDIKE